MIEDIKKDATERMRKSVVALKNMMANIRAGRAHTGLLDQIMVDYYGAEMPLNQVANVGVEDARTLTVTPWEKPMLSVIEKAIMISNLGLNPATAGMTIRIPIPPLTEERRLDLVKMAKSKAEDGRVAARNIRRDANSALKRLLKEKQISVDEERDAEDEIQQLTDSIIKQIDVILAEKEADLMEV